MKRAWGLMTPLVRAYRLIVEGNAHVGGGVVVGAPTGGTPAAGGINAEALKVNNVDVSTGTKVAILAHRANVGNDGGTPAAGVWTKRTLTEISDVDGIVTVASSVATLGAGKYRVDFMGVFGGSGSSGGTRVCAQRWRNTTAGTTLAVSDNVITQFTNQNMNVHGSCTFTITENTTFELQYFCANNPVTNGGLGWGGGAGDEEIFARVVITKL